MVDDGAGWSVQAFERERPRLLAVAYRLTGSVADAEDAVQDAWLRLAGTDTDVRDLQAWLTRVVSRLCLDRLGSAARRRETYVGQWLPEPVVRPWEGGSPDPLDVVVADEDARFGALVVLERLTPAQRVALVLHDAFDVPFEEVGQVLGVSTEAARQHASRARRATTDAPEPVPDPEHEEAVGRFLAAMATGDLAGVVAALHPEATATGDAGGTTGTALRVVSGAEKVARFYLGLLGRFGDQALTAVRPVRVNGQLGVWIPGIEGAEPRLSSPPRVGGFTVRDGRVAATYDVANPDKLGGVRL